ncbi:hypothetical protein M433DRAFT_158465 [Acidomyces richmondensis BFW]|nr:hypothetical protein M433DRAFT_158465 [Acidomyces richmondensis BFW]
MGLTIIISKPHLRTWFTSLDQICGTVVFTNKRPVNVANIVVYVEGHLRTSTKSHNVHQEIPFSAYEHALFCRRSIVFQSNDNPTGKSCTLFAPGTHIYQFNLGMPLFTCCCTSQSMNNRHIQSTLPPSFELVSESLKISVSYRIRAVVDRPGLLRCNLTSTRAVEFRPLPPPDLGSLQRPRYLKVTKDLGDQILEQKEDNATGERNPPPYDTAILFEVSIPESRIIRVGDRLDLGITVFVPHKLRKALATIWLESLAIRLRSTTMITVECATRAHIGYLDLCKTQGLLPLEFSNACERFEVPSELWRNHVYPLILPSFASCGIQRQYALEIAAGFFSPTTNKVYTVRTSVDVAVKNADFCAETPPEYTVEEGR